MTLWPGLARFLLLYGTLYGAFGVHSPYFPTLLLDRGLTPEMIGLVLATGTGVRLIAGPATGRLADRLHAPRAVLACCLGGAALAGMGFLLGRGLWPVLAISVLYSAMVAPLAPLTDTLALGTAGRQSGSKLSYGWLRGAGSSAFVVGSIASGQAIEAFGIGVAVLLNTVLFACAALCAPRVPVLLPPKADKSIAGDDLWQLVRLPTFRRLVLAVGFILGSHALHDGFIVIRWSAVGIGTEIAGLLWSEQVIAEVIVFLFVGPRLLPWLGSGGALTLAAITAAIRWIVMAETAWLPAMAVVEPLHGITFALLHLAAMRLLAEIVPPQHAGTALGLYGTSIALAALGATLVSGPLYAGIGARGFWAMAGLALVALPITLTLREPPARMH